MDNKIFSSVFKWLFIGLLTTFVIAYLTVIAVSNSYSFAKFLYSNSGFWILAIIEIIVAIYLSARIYSMDGTKAKMLYLLYCCLTGLTFSSIFIVYQITSIIYVFLATSLILGIFSYIGKVTNIDLSKYGIYLFMALIGIIILEIVNIFLLNSTLNLVLCIVCLIVFMIYIAYDIQKVKRLSTMGVPEENLAIMGAFQLYLDFINIFIRLLELFGNRRD